MHDNLSRVQLGRGGDKGNVGKQSGTLATIPKNAKIDKCDGRTNKPNSSLLSRVAHKRKHTPRDLQLIGIN